MGVVRRWLFFSEQYNLDPYNLKFDQIMAFMEYIHETEKSFSMVSRTKSLMSVLRKLIGDPFTPGNRYLMDKFVAATFNINPPIPMKIEDNWDVNILLDYFVQLGPKSTWYLS